VPAVAVAPYFHAKLQSHRLGGDPDLPMAIRVVDLSDSQINALIERIEAGLGIGPSAGPEPADEGDEDGEGSGTRH